MTRALAGAAALFALILWGGASAQELESADVERFIVAMKAMNDVGDRYSEDEFEALMPDMAGGQGLMAMLDDDGNVVAFSRMAEAMQKAPSSPAVADVKKTVKDAGFSSFEAFGETGDAVMMALLALQVEQDGGIDEADIEEMRNMPAEMKAMMPPGAMAQIEAAIKMIDAAENAPPGNIETVRPYKAQLENAFEG